MRTTHRTRIAALCLALVALLIAPQAALAALEDRPAQGSLSSSTNPWVPGDKDIEWRYVWGNSMYPDLNVSNAPADDSTIFGATTGFYYLFDQNPLSIPPVGGPNVTSDSEGTLRLKGVDVAGVIRTTGWTPVQGAVQPGEGFWWMHIRFFNAFRAAESSSTSHVRLGIDLTAPGSPENLVGGVVAGVPALTWTEANRRILTWTPKAYDALSGVGGFQASVNGDVADLDFLENAAPTAPYEWWQPLFGPPSTLPQASTLTIENLPNGVSTVGVKTIDRATNESTPSVVTAWVDSDTPSITVLAPVGVTVPSKTTLTAQASDGAGVSSVRYYVDGRYVGAGSLPPYAVAVNLSSFANGTHTLKAVATDMIGATTQPMIRPHTAEMSTTFVLDKMPPTLSSTAFTVNPIYPRVRDGYRDYTYVKFSGSGYTT
ncbi:MAG: hypothetical protein FDZ75_00850, partial [Actinobacteria bacterium]